MKAVLTGDIVGFTSLGEEERKDIIQILKQSFEYIDRHIPGPLSPSFQLFRGDSFQGLVEDPRDALAVALRIKSDLIRSQPSNSSKGWDARIAIGIGSIEFLPGKVSEGDGAAYRNSGILLDSLKGNFRLAVQSPDDETNREINTELALLDAVIAKWSPAQADTVFRLLEDKTQQHIGHEIGISQAAVHYRVKGAGWFAVEKLLERYEIIIDNLMG